MRPVRRSKRSKESRCFKAGDVVEIDSASSTGVSKLSARLVRKIDKTQNDEHSIWVVTFEDPEVDDDEVSERKFGPIIRRTNSEQCGGVVNASAETVSRLRRGRSRANSKDPTKVSGAGSKIKGICGEENAGAKRKGRGPAHTPVTKKKRGLTAAEQSSIVIVESSKTSMGTLHNPEAIFNTHKRGEDIQCVVHTRSSRRKKVNGIDQDKNKGPAKKGTQITKKAPKKNEKKLEHQQQN